MEENKDLRVTHKPADLKGPQTSRFKRTTNQKV